MPTVKLILGSPRSFFMKRDIRLSVSKENREIFDVCKVLKSKGYSPSRFICIATLEKYDRDVKLKIEKHVLSPPQQKVIEVRTRPREKTPDEIRDEQLREEAAKIADEERKRRKVVEMENIRKLIKS